MKQSNAKRYGIAIAIVAILGLAVALALYQSNAQPQVTPAMQSVESAPPELGRTEISYHAQPGITSLEQLKSEAKNVLTQESEYGELVDSVEGHKGGTNGAYWSFYVNGEMAQVGAGSYVQEEGDYIEWKFQKL